MLIHVLEVVSWDNVMYHVLLRKERISHKRTAEIPKEYEVPCHINSTGVTTKISRCL